MQVFNIFHKDMPPTDFVTLLAGSFLCSLKVGQFQGWNSRSGGCSDTPSVGFGFVGQSSQYHYLCVLMRQQATGSNHCCVVGARRGESTLVLNIQEWLIGHWPNAVACSMPRTLGGMGYVGNALWWAFLPPRQPSNSNVRLCEQKH